jgi:acyl-lipid omega-6 desaturase (Delta-12 desaturase)
MMDNSKTKKKDSGNDWIEIVKRYNKPDPLKSWWQIINSVGPYIILWVVMIKTIEISYWLTLLISVLAAGFMIRIFIIFHDCGHGSFSGSKRINTIIGIITGLMVFTPYHKWSLEHHIHHQTVGNLDKRGTGDITTLTVDEYSKLSEWQKFSYRFYRNPVFLLGIAPILLFTIIHRLTKKSMSPIEKLYVHLSTLAIAAAVTLLIVLFGWKIYLLIQLPVLYIASVHGVWLFYVQHQFRNVLWTNSKKWDYKNIALKGSSMYKLPLILNWFTGNIGFHHIHHLCPGIPNYNLKKCYNENQIFREIKPITFFSAFESLQLRLYDEKRKMMVSFREI